ncbi:MAG: hypothetical protein GY903_29540 [Fuerstiella sp.]|nr:hypothetical protein [Fuerstiella sp.]MCP4858639.1 hypothetical protein [Fuerstiella sp.]
MGTTTFTIVLRRLSHVGSHWLVGDNRQQLPCEERHKHTEACHVYGFHDFKRAFATYNAASLSAVRLQRLMKHTDFSTTQGYIDYAELMTEKPDVFVPDILRIEDSGKSGTSG